MAATAVIIAGLALVVSVWSGYHSTSQTKVARESARSAEEAAAIAREVLRQGAAPEWTAVVADHAPGLWHSLELKLSSSPLGDVLPGDVLVMIPRTSRLEFSGSQYGVDGPSPSSVAKNHESLMVGAEPAVWKIQFRDDGDAGSTDLRVTGRIQGMSWTVAVPVNVPADILKTVY